MRDKIDPYSDGFATDCQLLVDGGDADGAPLHHRKYAVPDNGSALMNESVSLNSIRSVVHSEVASVECVDLHTHLLPPSHGPTLCLWGIDELLTYVSN